MDSLNLSFLDSTKFNKNLYHIRISIMKKCDQTEGSGTTRHSRQTINYERKKNKAKFLNWTNINIFFKPFITQSINIILG